MGSLMARPLLYDANGRPIRASAWDAGGTGRRTGRWYPTSDSINTLLGSGEVSLVRERSHDEVRRSPWAERGLGAHVAKAIGTGIRPKVRAETDAFGREVKEAFDDWVEECDADGTSSFYGQQAVALRAVREGGDCFARFRPRRREDGLSVPLQVQLLEAEMCDASKNEALSEGRVIRAGIEFDARNLRVVYHIWRSHPGERVTPLVPGINTTVPVPAREIAHLFHVQRPGQVRGVPGLSTVLAMLHEIREVEDAYVQRVKIQNLFATFEEVPDDDSALDRGTGDEVDDDDVPMPDIPPGAHVLLPPGHKIAHSEPPNDSGNQSAFIRDKLRAVAAGCGCTYEQISGDYSNVSFSSVRASLIQLHRELEQVRQNVVVFQFCRPVWRRFVETAILAGRIRVPRTESLTRIMRPFWQADGWEYVEPEKDVRAAVRRIRAGLSSRRIEAAKLGIDVEELDRQIAEDNQRAADLGLVLDSDPSSDSDGGARAAALTEPGESGGAGGDGASAAA